MRTLTVRLPEKLAAQIEAESKARQLTKSDVVRERLESTEGDYGARTTALDTIADLVGSVDRLPDDLSSRKKHYLIATGYGKRSR